MVQEIEISKLRVHPKNVRKTYTNIDELAGQHENAGNPSEFDGGEKTRRKREHTG